MTSPVTFPLFPSLPAELRLMIWKFAILMDNRDRLVLLNDVTKRIICTSSLIIPHLQVNVECRHVALGLYPLRLPVSSMIFASRLPENRVAWRYSRHSKGVVFINTDYDRFVLAVDRVGGCDIRVRTINGRWLRPCKGFGWRSSRLSPTQCANIKQIMVFDMKDPEWVTNESSHTPEW
ncbi:hypothetical protein F5Y18DRAFT_82868 [Xylariaceae sp. FL1019]|nr:hypothetical protein F5Y18DRAFT_82868 [Xylariaceae sp. FL1019]